MRLITLCVFLLVLLATVCTKHHNNYPRRLIKFINEGDYSWKAAENPVTRMGLHRVRVLSGSHLSPREMRSLPTKEKETTNLVIPTEFDARYNWPNCDSIWSIKDQGNCGSCWAVSTSSVMSDRVCIASGDQTRVNISAEQLTACCTDCGVGCNGGYPDKAWPYFFSHGLVTGGDYNSNEGCQPYEIAPGDEHQKSKYLICSPNKCTNKNYNRAYNQDLHFGKTAYFLPNDMRSIQAEIMTNGPVVAGFTVYSDFPAYSKGVYQHIKGTEYGGHAVRILGWGVEKGVDYWLIANSWNRTWGDDGYVKFIRGINNCGIEEFVTAGLVDPN